MPCSPQIPGPEVYFEPESLIQVLRPHSRDVPQTGVLTVVSSLQGDCSQRTRLVVCSQKCANHLHVLITEARWPPQTGTGTQGGDRASPPAPFTHSAQRDETMSLQVPPQPLCSTPVKAGRRAVLSAGWPPGGGGTSPLGSGGATVLEVRGSAVRHPRGKWKEGRGAVETRLQCRRGCAVGI